MKNVERIANVALAGLLFLLHFLVLCYYLDLVLWNDPLVYLNIVQTAMKLRLLGKN